MTDFTLTAAAPVEIAANFEKADTVTGDDLLFRHFTALAGGHIEALAGIYDHCAADLFGFALFRTGSRQDAADVVQEVFVRLAQTGAKLAEVRNPRSYLLAMTHRAAVDLARRSRRLVSIDDAVAEPVADDAESRADAAAVTSALGKLPPAQRAAVYLRHYEGLSFAAIGTVTGVPTFTAASRVRLGLRKLRKLLGVKP